MAEYNQTPAIIEQYQNIGEDYFGDIIDDAYDPNFDNGGFRVAANATRETTMQILAYRLYAHSIQTPINDSAAKHHPRSSLYETDDVHAIYHSHRSINFELPDELFDDVDDIVLEDSASLARIVHDRCADNHDVGSNSVHVEIVPKTVLNGGVQ